MKTGKPEPKTLELSLTTEPEWAHGLKRTPTLPGRCCADYLEYVREGQPPRRGGFVYRYKKHLLVFRRFGTEVEPMLNAPCLLFKYTRIKSEGEWQQAFNAIEFPVFHRQITDTAYVDFHLSEKKPRYASESRMKEVCGLTHADCARIAPCRLIYRMLSGICPYCLALINDNLLVDNNLREEAQIADALREEHLQWFQTNRPDVWHTMRTDIPRVTAGTELAVSQSARETP